MNYFWIILCVNLSLKQNCRVVWRTKVLTPHQKLSAFWSEDWWSDCFRWFVGNLLQGNYFSSMSLKWRHLIVFVDTYLPSYLHINSALHYQYWCRYSQIQIISPNEWKKYNLIFLKHFLEAKEYLIDECMKINFIK